MSGQLPEGSLFKVTLEVRLPCLATEDQAIEWMRFCVGDNGSCSSANPLLEHDFETWGNPGFSAEYTGYVGRTEVSRSVEMPDGSHHYSVRHFRERA